MKKHLPSGARGASFVEALLLVGAVALTAVGAFTAFGNDVGRTIGNEGQCIDNLACNGGASVAIPGGEGVAGDTDPRAAADAAVLRAQEAVASAYDRVWQWEEAARQAAIAGDSDALASALANLERARADHAAAMTAARDAYETQHALTPMEERGVLENFADGFVRGDFAENPTISATVGQVVGGFVPIWGQIGDVRDISAAVDGVLDGRDGAWGDLALGVVGIIPGGDLVRGGVRVGRGVDDAAAVATRHDELLARIATRVPGTRAQEAIARMDPRVGGLDGAAIVGVVDTRTGRIEYANSVPRSWEGERPEGFLQTNGGHGILYEQMTGHAVPTRMNPDGVDHIAFTLTQEGIRWRSGSVNDMLSGYVEGPGWLQDAARPLLEAEFGDAVNPSFWVDPL